MAKKVLEMSAEEFNKTYPLTLKEYNPIYKEWYENEKQLLSTQ